ncbi:MAG TPA: response regulator transcription factor [Gemmatimonadaceae bacterium]|nr:response regulator transcription factor [Gemmatimonadaceae bacterium]
MATANALSQARASFEREAWRDAHELWTAADRETPLEPEDLDHLAACAFMLGNDVESTELWTRAHHEFLSRGAVEQAAFAAFRIGFSLAFKGQAALGNGWLARARRVLDDANRDSVVRGYLLIPDAIRTSRMGDPARGYEMFSEAVAIGRRFGNRDLVAVARQGQGRAMIKRGQVAEGLALLDEVMVGVTAGELSPLHVGDVYCSVIDACTEIFDLRRAQEWTAALTQWCERQPDELPYRGACLVRRAEIMQLHGSWSDAMEEASRACERLVAPPPKPAAGLAVYQCGELHRLRGELAKAEEAYRQASELGRKPQPGLALMRLAQGDVDGALSSIRRVMDETRDVAFRSRVLGAYVEILVAAGDTGAASAAAAELRDIAESVDAPFLRALAAHAKAVVCVANGDHEAALGSLREARRLWLELEAPYEDARSRVLISVAARHLGDADTADVELTAARRAFERLGAVLDVAHADELAKAASSPRRLGQLTAREVEVLASVATGKTNRAIADALGLSEKTVARHVSNIFTKLGVSSRAAATAYAYKNHLV